MTDVTLQVLPESPGNVLGPMAVITCSPGTSLFPATPCAPILCSLSPSLTPGAGRAPEPVHRELCSLDLLAVPGLARAGSLAKPYIRL